MSDLSARSGLSKPSLGLSLLFCAVLTGVVAWLRLRIFEHTSVGIGYALPIVLVGWTRRRGLVWLMCLVFFSMALFKFRLNINVSTTPPQQRVLGFLLLMGDLFIIAAIVDLVLRRERSLELGRHELHRKGEDLKFSNEGLRERQEITDTLLKLSRSLTAGLSREAFQAITNTVHRLLGTSTAIALFELRGQELAVIDHNGFAADTLQGVDAPNQTRFARLVTESPKTLAIGNLSLRPDLNLQSGSSGEGFQGVLGAPLKLESKVAGALIVCSPRVRSWTETDISLIESLAAQASVSIAATRLLEQIENEHKELQTILDTVPFGIVRLDAKAARLICNPVGAALLGIPEVSDAGPGNWPKAKLVGRGGDIAPGEDPLLRALRGEVTVAMELEIHLPGGSKINTLCNAAPIRDRSGAISGAIGAFIDVSAHKTAKEETDSTFDFNDWLNVECRQLQPHAERKDLEFSCKGLPSSIRLHVDQSKLSRVLTGLVDNAIKYTDAGYVRILAVLLPDGSPSVCVKDSGAGIAPEELSTIFEEYAQMPTAARLIGGGGGSGLFIAKRFVESMGGNLEAVSQPGRGSTFTFTLPASCVIQ
jgi:PAS domain-containing protein/anti-sigma regulatory factor (Ser/Thr protein kinase)